VEDEVGGELFVVLIIGGDECVLEINRGMGEQGAGFTDFAVFFFAGGTFFLGQESYRVGSTASLLDQGAAFGF